MAFKERKELTDDGANAVVGGSIGVSPDRTTCGYNCNNEYAINDFNSLVSFVGANKTTMGEQAMLSEMCALGYITKL